MTDVWRWVDQMHDEPSLDGFGLRDLGELHKALNAALAEVRGALAPALRRAAIDGLPQQRMAELSGYSIQAVRKLFLACAAKMVRPLSLLNMADKPVRLPN